MKFGARRCPSQSTPKSSCRLLYVGIQGLRGGVSLEGASAQSKSTLSNPSTPYTAKQRQNENTAHLTWGSHVPQGRGQFGRSLSILKGTL
jgi:hypothetical protein